MSDSPTFKPGDVVQFGGLHAKGIKIQPVEGELFLNDKNKKPGVMMIKGDKQKMMFMPDGSIYCHAQYGCVLKLKEEPAEQIKVTKAELIAPAEVPAPTDEVKS